ncbi:MAG TPA: zf-TFIIB domain-containing protein [Polyangiaceae bacterium]|nr:zf-TFIIB domain-containing protein [Polyangiaceae bacterium]
MIDCPACASSTLTAFTLRANVTVELCGGCKGMLVDERAFEQLAGTCDLGTLGEGQEMLGGLGPCLRCNTVSWQWHSLAGEVGAGLGMCGTCGMFWFRAGELDRLQRHLLAEKRRARRGASEPAAVDATSTAAPAPLSEQASARASEEPFERISFDDGIGNRLGVPLAIGFGVAFSATPPGRFFGSLVGMPFHELGHALASWLGSRFAMPLPFFTVWSNAQSLLFGLGLAGLLAAFGYRSWREGRRFGLGLALALLAVQLVLSCFVPARQSLMVQILGGALGEVALGALVLIAFHFPLPDRLRWDFWRWPALVPGGICFGHAMLTWIAAAKDARRIPWGAAIGNESDGDMNRLVRDFGWSATELARFYLTATGVAALAIGAAYAFALQRQRAQGMARMSRQKSMA